jgi:hypothetical protein
MYQAARNSVMLVFTLCSLAGAGQVSRKPGVSSHNRPDAVALSNQRQHALWTVKELFAVSRAIRNEATKIRIEGQIADILWDYDEPRAREYFAESLHQLDSTQSAGDNTSLTLSARLQLRRVLMGMIARRDPTLAQRFLQAYTRSQKTDEVDPSLYAETATNMAARDLQRAVATLRASMSGGITHEFVTSLRLIRDLDPAAATDLFYKAMVLSAANDSEAFAKSLPLLAAYVFDVQSTASFPLPQDSSNPQDGDTGSAPAPAANPVDAGLINNFLSFAFQALLPQDSLALRGPSGAGLPAYVALMQLIPYYEQYQPQQASVIVGGFNQLAAAIQDPAKRALLVNLAGKVTPSQIVQAGASLIKSDEKDIVYDRASLQATRHGDFEQALSIAGSIQDEKLRQEAESVARTETANSAISKGDLDTACRSILSIPLLRQQAVMFSQIMRTLTKKKDVIRAGQILDMALRVMEKAPETPDKVRALLLLFEVGTQIDESRAMTILQLVVAAINRSDWSDGSKGEARGASVAADVKRADAWFNFQGSFGLLARTDFDTALALAQSVRQQELSISAQLAACQGILNRKDLAPVKKQPPAYTRRAKG